MTIKVINQESIAEWAESKGIEEPDWEDLTDEEFSEINEMYDYGWEFDSLEEFVNAFNNDLNECPVPTNQFIRIYND